MSPRIFIALALAVGAVTLNGCATGKNDTTGFAIQQEVILEQPYADAWQHVKRTLRANEYEIYTRDKRGTFVAYKGGKSLLGVLNSPREKYTLNLEPVTNSQTKVSVEAMKQVYGVSLTTYPDWHDRKTTNEERVAELIAALSGTPAQEAAPVENTEQAAVEPAEEAKPDKKAEKKARREAEKAEKEEREQAEREEKAQKKAQKQEEREQKKQNKNAEQEAVTEAEPPVTEAQTAN